MGKRIVYDYTDLLFYAEDHKLASWNEAIAILRDSGVFDFSDSSTCYIYKDETEGIAGQIIDGYLTSIGEEDAEIIFDK